MEQFTESYHCKSGLHCGLCRQLVGGRGFRRQLGTALSLPDGKVDFACPQGKPWTDGDGKATDEAVAVSKTAAVTKAAPPPKKECGACSRAKRKR